MGCAGSKGSPDLGPVAVVIGSIRLVPAEVGPSKFPAARAWLISSRSGGAAVRIWAPASGPTSLNENPVRGSTEIRKGFRLPMT